MRKFVTIVLGTLLAAAATSCSSSPSAPTTKATVGDLNGKTPAQILSAATTAANKAGSAHYVLTAVQGKQTQTITGDAAQSQGRQSVVQGSQNIQVIYVGGIAYVQGNAAGLTSAMGITATVAKTYADKWIAVHSSDSLYKSIVSAVTLAGTLEQLDPSGTLAITGVTTVGGLQAIGVKGGLPGTPQSGVTGSTTLFVATSKPTVPLKFSGTASQGSQHVHDTGIFTDWGKALDLSAPAGAVAFSTLPAK